MKAIKSLIAVVLTAVMLNGFAVAVSADSAEAEAEANAEVVCETGDYGQAINCQAKTDAKASTKVVTRHEPVDTGLNVEGIAVAVGTITTGAAAVVTRFRLGK